MLRKNLPHFSAPFGTYSVSFWLDCTAYVKNAHKFFIMKKQLRIVRQRRPAIEPFSSVSSVPHCFFSRHLRRRPVSFRYGQGVVVYCLPGGLFAHCYPSGYRFISGLPF